MRGSTWEFPSGSQTRTHAIYTTGLCLQPPALGKRPSLILSALVLCRIRHKDGQAGKMGGKWRSGLRWMWPQQWVDLQRWGGQDCSSLR